MAIQEGKVHGAEVMHRSAWSVRDVSTKVEPITSDRTASRTISRRLGGSRMRSLVSLGDTRSVLQRFSSLALSVIIQSERTTLFGMQDPVKCSFCHKPSDDVAKVVAGPDGVYICNECVELCQEIIRGDLPVGR
jgi:hypothetical protein